MDYRHTTVLRRAGAYAAFALAVALALPMAGCSSQSGSTRVRGTCAGEACLVVTQVTTFSRREWRLAGERM